MSPLNEYYSTGCGAIYTTDTMQKNGVVAVSSISEKLSPSERRLHQSSSACHTPFLSRALVRRIGDQRARLRTRDGHTQRSAASQLAYPRLSSTAVSPATAAASLPSADVERPFSNYYVLRFVMSSNRSLIGQIRILGA